MPDRETRVAMHNNRLLDIECAETIARDDLQDERRQTNTNKISPNAFDLWWVIYPHKVAKKDAQKTFPRVVKTQEQLGTLMRNTLAWQPVFMARAANKRPYPATFLNSGQWEDPPPEDLVLCAMNPDELMNIGKDPTQYGWRLVAAAGGRGYVKA